MIERLFREVLKQSTERFAATQAMAFNNVIYLLVELIWTGRKSGRYSHKHRCNRGCVVVQSGILWLLIMSSICWASPGISWNGLWTLAWWAGASGCWRALPTCRARFCNAGNTANFGPLRPGGARGRRG